MSVRDDDRSIVDRAMFAKRRIGRQVSRINLTDTLGVMVDSAATLDKLVDKIPYYAVVEQHIGEVLDSKSTADIRKELTTLTKGLVVSLVVLKTGKAPNGRKLKRLGRGLNYANISLSSVLLLATLIEIRRRRDINFPNPYYVPIEEIVSSVFNRYNER